MCPARVFCVRLCSDSEMCPGLQFDLQEKCVREMEKRMCPEALGNYHFFGNCVWKEMYFFFSGL